MTGLLCGFRVAGLISLGPTGKCPLFRFFAISTSAPAMTFYVIPLRSYPKPGLEQRQPEAYFWPIERLSLTALPFDKGEGGHPVRIHSIYSMALSEYMHSDLVSCLLWLDLWSIDSSQV